jgi:hypothetical protein
VVEHLPFKQVVEGSIPSTLIKNILINAPLAQLVEQLTLNQWVAGSIPARRILY